MNDVFLIGFMGAGKSTVGPQLAQRLSLPFVDLDAQIAAEQDRTIADIFAEDGEAAFRRLELDALASRAARPRAVVACGGGIVTLQESRELLGRLGTVVYMRTTMAETLARIKDRSSRPLLAGEDAAAQAEALLASRSGLYEEVADIAVDTVGISPARIAECVADTIRAQEAVR